MATASATTELDQLLKKGLKLTHSTHPNSTIELRIMLDELIKQRYGPEKMLCNVLSKRHLEEEANFPGMVPIPPPQQQGAETDEVINLTNSPTKTISDSPDTIMDSDDGLSGAGLTTDGVSGAAGVTPMLTTTDDDGNLKDFGDLNCCVCGEMMFTATNRLIECAQCGALYHQECHKPPISDEDAIEDQDHSWQCDNCCNKPSTSKAAGILVAPEEHPMPLVAKPKSSATSSRSSSSSNSSSPFYGKHEQTATAAMPPTVASGSSSSSGKHHHHKSSSSSSTKSHKEERTMAASNAKPGAIISVIAAAEKSSSHSSSSSSSSTKKTSSHSSIKSSSSSKSTKHHESSSSSSGSKRKSNK